MEMLRALGALAERPVAGLEPIAASLELGELPPVHEHTDLFTHQLVPYASVYLSPEGVIGGEVRDRIGGFWRALELEAPAEPDHLSVMLAAYARLREVAVAASEASARVALEHRCRVFLNEHLLSWLPLYLVHTARLGSAFYRAWSRLLLEALRACQEPVGQGADPADSIHFRLAPPPFGSGDGIDEVLAGLLQPVRSGLVLTRADLASAARTLGLAGRIGERRFMLEALLKQDPRRLSEWLVDRCGLTLELYASGRAGGESWLEPWARRVEATRDRLAAAL